MPATSIRPSIFAEKARSATPSGLQAARGSLFGSSYAVFRLQVVSSNRWRIEKISSFLSSFLMITMIEVFKDAIPETSEAACACVQLVLKDYLIFLLSCTICLLGFDRVLRAFYPLLYHCKMDGLEMDWASFYLFWRNKSNLGIVSLQSNKLPFLKRSSEAMSSARLDLVWEKLRSSW